MTTSLWQWSYNGLTFGAGTNLEVITADGLGDLGTVRNGDQPRPSDTGMLAGWDFLGTRTVVLTMDLTVGAAPSMSSALDAVKGAFAPLQSSLLPLVFWLPGQVDPRQVYARCRKLAAPIDISYEGGLTSVSVQLDCVDPRIYDTTVQGPTVGLPAPSSGLTFPATFPATFGGTTGGGGQLLAVNGGNFESRPVLTITGGVCTNPRVENQTTGQTVAFAITLAATDVLTVDMDARTVFLNGTGDRSSVLVPASQFWTLQPGVNQIGFYSADASPTGAELTVTFASAWL